MTPSSSDIIASSSDIIASYSDLPDDEKYTVRVGHLTMSFDILNFVRMNPECFPRLFECMYSANQEAKRSMEGLCSLHTALFPTSELVNPIGLLIEVDSHYGRMSVQTTWYDPEKNY
jgi:hypothetical protein